MKLEAIYEKDINRTVNPAVSAATFLIKQSKQKLKNMYLQTRSLMASIKYYRLSKTVMSAMTEFGLTATLVPVNPIS
ncbi:hypothetical protein [Bacteroides thetaiotaomicron]|uniref:hypothetical protein n=1 Tax=Bacteroides thetaiotaomicron TaxID=818 RepID=UPI002165A653|nr:hypothetical protein [Bacteroides thetaiotaomicron]MCS3196129.1 hypothetical protein [Bacteroides thetaiotaomicron]